MLNRSLIEEIQAVIVRCLPDSTGPGFAVGVYHQGEPLAEYCQGIARVGHPAPLTPDSQFRIASVTKQFTVAAVLRACEQGLLSLDETLDQVFPGFPEYGRAITLLHLARHTSGLRDYEKLVPPDPAPQVSDADVLALMMQQGAGDFAPGTRYRYSNSGYALLGQAVERRSGLSWPAFLRREVFDPAGLRDAIAFREGINVVPNRVYGHRRRPGGIWYDADQCSTSAVLGDGGIYLSIREFAQWDAALRAGKVLSPASITLMGTRGLLNDGTPTEYGLGYRLEDPPPHLVLHHTGSSTGFNHCSRRIPAIGLATVVFSNFTSEHPKELGPLIEAIALKAIDAGH